MIKISLKYLFILLSILITGCSYISTQKKFLAQSDSMLKQQEYDKLLRIIEDQKDKSYKNKDRVLYYLDSGMLNYYCGIKLLSTNKDSSSFKKAKSFLNESIKLLSKAEEEIEYLYTKSVSKEVMSFIINDNIKDYYGENFEDIYTNIFKALSFLELAKISEEEEKDYFDKAFVEIRKITLKLNDIQDKYEKEINKIKQKEIKTNKYSYTDYLLARLLSLLLYRTEGLIDDAKIDLIKINNIKNIYVNNYNLNLPGFEKYLTETNDARLNLFCFVGLSPEKKAKTLRVHTEENTIIIANSDENKDGQESLKDLKTIYWEDVKKNLHFKMQLPYLSKKISQVDKILLTIDGKKNNIYKIENLEDKTIDMFKNKEIIIFFKTLVRALEKTIADNKIKEEIEKKLKKDSIGSLLLKYSTDIAFDISENTDLRISHFFPASVYSAEIYLNEGFHNIKVQYINKQNKTIYEESFNNFELKKDKLNILQSIYLN